ncbi:MAG: DUF4419 domain-containing protein, partial [Cycloclasticus sp.]|nr:DUF4419 domain-containing protein [Cycloclasticus sp.]
MSPEIMWYTILNELAIIIKGNPTAYASLFTTSDEKQTIVVPTDDPTLIDLDLIKNALYDLVPTDIDLFLPTFSTSTESSNMACLASFCDAVTPFYNYSTFMCGHRSIKITGTDEDWDKIERHLTEISKLMSHDWLREAWDIVVSIRLAIRDGDVAFWKNIFTEEICGSGSQYVISGWFSGIFNNDVSGDERRVENFASHIAQVPYVNADTNRKFTLNYGLFHSNEDFEGFIVP